MHRMIRAALAAALLAPLPLAAPATAAGAYVRLPDRVSGVGNPITVWDAAGPQMSADGRYVVSRADFSGGDWTKAIWQAVLYDRLARSTTLVSRAAHGGLSGAVRAKDGKSSISSEGVRGVAISANGRYVAFSSNAQDILKNDPHYGNDVFVYDVRARRVKRVPGAPRVEIRALRISDDGKFVVYRGFEVDEHLYRVAVATGRTEVVSIDTHGPVRVESTEMASRAVIFDLSADGRYLLFGAANSDPTTPVTNRLLLRDLVARRTIGLSDGVTATLPHVNLEKVTVVRAEIDDSGTSAAYEVETTYLSGISKRSVWLRNVRSNQQARVLSDDIEENTSGGAFRGISGDGKVVFYATREAFVAVDEGAAFHVLAEYRAGGTRRSRLEGVACSDTVTGDTAVPGYGQVSRESCFDIVRVTSSRDGRVIAFHTRAALDPGDTKPSNDVYLHVV